MKSETKNKIIIIQFIIIIIIIGYIIFSASIQGRKNTEYKNTVAGLETEVDRAREENTRLDEIITGLESDKRGLKNIISRNGKEIQRLKDITDQLRDNNKESIGIIEEIERLFTEIMGD